MNAAIYARVSTDVQAEFGYSLGAQIADCTQKARDLGATIIKEFVDDGYSGAYLERPALESLREALRAKMFDIVVVYDIDRLSRNLSHQLLITDDIEASGAALHFVKADYESSPEGRLFYAIRGAFAGYEREKFKERTLRGKIAMLKQGKTVQDSHVYGYDFDKETRSYIINEIEAKNVKEIFRLYLSGFGGTTAITRHLNSNTDKFPPPNRRKWVISTVRDILRREMYTGKFFSHKIYHYRTGIKGEIKGERPKDEWIPMECPAIISDEEHNQAVALLRNNRTFDHHKRAEIFIFQGLLYCAKCGRRLSVRNGGGNTYYMCWRNGATGEHGPGCGARSMQCFPTDAAIWEVVTAVCKSPASIEAYIRQSTPASHPQADADAVRTKELQKIKDERQALLTWVAGQLITHEEATSRLTALKAAENRIIRENTRKPPEAVLMGVGTLY